MTLQRKTIRGNTWLYWKYGSSWDQVKSLGMEEQTLKIIRVALDYKGKNIGVVRRCVFIFGRDNLHEFLTQLNKKQIRQELRTLE